MPNFFKVHSHVVAFNQHRSAVGPAFGLLMLWAHGASGPCSSESRVYVYTRHTNRLHPL